MNSGMRRPDAGPRVALADLFRQSRSPFGQLPVFQTILQDASARCAVALHELANLKTSFVIERIEEVPVAVLLSSNPGLIWSLFKVPQWGEQACVGFDDRLLFRVLDAMYGGEGGPSEPAPDRSLSRLERTVCGQFATMLIEQVKLGLSKLTAFDVGPVRVDQFLDMSAFDKSTGDLVLIRMHLVELGERLLIAIPFKGLELARERLENVEPKIAGQDIDPDWSRSFQRSAAASAIEMTAYVEGPPMLLSDVAAWATGSVVEFDAACLHNIRLEVDGGDAIFEGRLGQSQGLFTVCVETPLTRPPRRSRPE